MDTKNRTLSTCYASPEEQTWWRWRLVRGWPQTAQTGRDVRQAAKRPPWGHTETLAGAVPGAEEGAR